MSHDEVSTCEFATEDLASKFFLPPPPPVRAEFGALSHPGKVRPNNEDHYLVLRRRRSLEVLMANLPERQLAPRADQDAYVMAVADGMGGAVGGELASMHALCAGVDLMLQAINWPMTFDGRTVREAAEKLGMYYRLMDRALIEHMRIEPSLAGMGTTLTVAFTAGLDAFIAHAGDSRAYLLRDGSLRRLTRDHTLAQELVDSGELAPGSEKARRLGHVLTNYLGGPRSGVDPEVHHLRLTDGDRLLLCTDGLTDLVEDGEIAQTLRLSLEPGDACRVLVELALARGGRDNVTAVLGRYSIPSGLEDPSRHAAGVDPI